jgi:F0F1-type ATP synthase delta subunit
MNKSSKSYAKSLFERLISENKIEERINSSQEDLLLFSASIESSKESFTDPFLAEEYKYQTLVTLFPKMTKTSHSLLKILLEKKQIYLLPEIYLEFEKFVKKHFKSVQCEIVRKHA